MRLISYKFSKNDSSKGVLVSEGDWVGLKYHLVVLRRRVSSKGELGSHGSQQLPHGWTAENLWPLSTSLLEWPERSKLGETSETVASSNPCSDKNFSHARLFKFSRFKREKNFVY